MGVCFVTSSFEEFLPGADRSLLESLDLLQDLGLEWFLLLHPCGALRSWLIHRAIPQPTLVFAPGWRGQKHLFRGSRAG